MAARIRAKPCFAFISVKGIEGLKKGKFQFDNRGNRKKGCLGERSFVECWALPTVACAAAKA